MVLDSERDDRATAEHIVQSSLGGTLEYPTLTCRNCNNGFGRGIEDDLASAMRALDFMDCKGAMPITIKNEVGRVCANLEWNEHKPVQIVVVGGKASRPAAVETIPSLIRNERRITMNTDLGFAWGPYQRAVLRIGYLVTFRDVGYRYALSTVAAETRRMMETDLPPLGVIL